MTQTYLTRQNCFCRYCCQLFHFSGYSANAISTGRGSGHTMFPTALGATRLWGIRLALGYLLAFTFGIGSLGIWLAISLSNVVGGVISLIWIKYGNWAKAVIKEGLTGENQKISRF